MKQILVNDVIQSYRFYAPIYDKLFGLVLEDGRKELIKVINTLNAGNILEIGVGTGLLLSHYPSMSKVVGIDLSEDMLKIAKERATALNDREIELKIMNAEETGFPDQYFDCVTIPYVLSVTPDPEKLILEARRVCKKGGTIIIINHFSGAGFWWLFEKAVKTLANKIGFRSDFSYEEQILRYDWEVIQVKSVNLFNLSKLVIIRN